MIPELLVKVSSQSTINLKYIIHSHLARIK